jgi:hypothetical protein
MRESYLFGRLADVIVLTSFFSIPIYHEAEKIVTFAA